MRAAVLLLALSAAVAAAPAPRHPLHRPTPAHAAPAPRDWTKAVALSPAGGFVMGNPAAPVKVVEFGSYTCSHCAEFAGEIEPLFVDRYVRTGQASFEFRNFVRDRYDMVAAILARCAGATRFFAVSKAVFDAQPDWLSQAEGYEHMHGEDSPNLTRLQKGLGAASASGLDSLFASNGLPAARQRACLGDPKVADPIIAMSRDGAENRHIPGTPTLFVNDEMLAGYTWATLDTAVDAALNKK